MSLGGVSVVCEPGRGGCETERCGEHALERGCPTCLLYMKRRTQFALVSLVLYHSPCLHAVGSAACGWTSISITGAAHLAKHLKTSVWQRSGTL